MFLSKVQSYNEIIVRFIFFSQCFESTWMDSMTLNRLADIYILS